MTFATLYSSDRGKRALRQPQALPQTRTSAPRYPLPVI